MAGSDAINVVWVWLLHSNVCCWVDVTLLYAHCAHCNIRHFSSNKHSSKHPWLTTIGFAQLFIAVICYGFHKLIAQLEKPKFSDYVFASEHAVVVAAAAASCSRTLISKSRCLGDIRSRSRRIKSIRFQACGGGTSLQIHCRLLHSQK